MTRSERDANLDLQRLARDNRWMTPAPRRVVHRGWFARLIRAVLGA